MSPVECTALFRMHQELLLVYEPFDAATWFISPQSLLGNRKPCELLSTPEGRGLVDAVISQLLDGAYT